MAIDNRNRVFQYAVLASLALHALLLFAFPGFVDTARRAASIPPQIIARLMEPEPALEKLTPPSTNEVSKPRPKPKPAAPIYAPRASAEPSPVPAAPTPVPSESQAPPQPAPPLAAIEPRPAQEPESLFRDQYRVQLIDEARRHKRYPPLARENDWQGDVLVGVAVGANGRASVSLKASSGYEVLDRQALEMFGQAARSVPVPPALRGQEFALDVRAVYGLED